ncbi:hypothetical protein BO86DRAFT_457776 [Aspergillus japonicus CBS 114.51]|uniref:Protein artemis n=1 Tax=Aspergillus japonicus CBS 114.51 TaxID=1448312 RepID=A0A8T8WVA2_ASPJA|nr:hypothetical protein BO86DRAFT_457776 [Aspergillus japonicus CBS 114.51]RAH79584.1 hypothetical protein BO86DRAFT_457776 [Aspergillus japonicus CBS 114.51]
MSTFDGIVQEFPYIQIDYFRKSPDRPPPLVCFLSHVHSDHLQGLESFRAPFIYCSAATRELLLRLEKYPHRMNFSKGILESRRLHYKHLSKLLRPIPLNTPTEIDLTPRLSIRVTLLDANHCTGAVMFLIEGDGKAILYTGDIRAEPWWVDSIIRHPILVPYTLGTKQLDKIYLDTTFARPSHICRVFPSKAEGLAELLLKVDAYPEKTTFYFRAWTMGYEEVWMALAAALRSKVHVDRYQMDLYRSLASSRVEGGINEVPSLCGFELGNRYVPGCLSEDERARIHSCEPGVQCSVARSKDTVYIIPVVNRTKDGSEMPELGAGGGGGDLYQIHELELPDKSALEQLEKLCFERIHDTQALSHTRQALIEAFESKRKALPLDSFGLKDADEMPLEKLVKMLGRGRAEETQLPGDEHPPEGEALPKVIRFPYSRHSSYSELCDLVAAFKPQDIHPCTVDPVTWTEDISMQNLFGHLCSGTEFAHDQAMRDMISNDEELVHRRKRSRQAAPSVTPQSSQQSSGITQQIEAREKPPPSPSPSLPPPPRPPRKNLPTFSSSTPSTEDLNLPSSFATINETTYNPTTPFPNPNPAATTTTTTPSQAPIILPATPQTTRIHRNTIRQAWTFLEALPDSQREAYSLSSLPSSWPPMTHEQASDDVADHDLIPYSSTQLDPSLEDKNNKTIPPSPDADADADTAPEPQQPRNNHTLPTPGNTTPSPTTTTTHPQTNPDPTSSQEEEKEEKEDETLIDDLITSPSPSTSPSPPSSTSSTNLPHRSDNPPPTKRHRPSTTNRPTRNPNRRPHTRTQREDAYRAAQADSYEAWATAVALMSTGNNHSEVEMEL